MEITNPVLMFSFIMFVILFAPILFSRMRLPGIVGLIVAGIIVGPHALGILRPENSIQLFSSVGMIYIMFLAGLEINLHEFNRQKKYSLVFGLITFMIPMVMGTLGSKWLFAFSWPSAILLASMFASHTLIPFPIVSRLGINRERSVVAAVGGTIITDTAALLVLAVIAEGTQAPLTAVFWVKQTFFLLLLVWFALWVLPRVAYFFFKILPPDGGVEFLFILTLVFLTGYLASVAGVEPIIGSFFAGLALGGIISEQSPLMNRLEFVGNTLFIPFFLLSVGMLVDMPALITSRNDWGIVLFMVVAVVVTKYLAAMVFTVVMKFSRDERHLIFGLSVNQAAATLAAVIVGLRLGIFSTGILNGTILMILVSCFLGPLFTEKYGQKIARLRQRVSDSVHPVDERIMVAVSRNKSAELLADIALSLRSKNSREPLFPLYVIQDGMEVDHRIAAGEKVMSSVVARVVAANVPVSPISRIDVTIAGGILHAVKEWHANILVMGSLLAHDSRFKAMFFGVYDKVSDESRQLLFLCRLAHPINTDQSIYILVPPLLEYQHGFNQAFEAVKNLAAGNRLALQVVAMADTMEHIKVLLKRKDTAVDIRFTVLDRWGGHRNYFKNAGLKETDSIVLMGARKGRLAWQPSFNRLYHELGADFPKNNIMLVHPTDDPHLMGNESRLLPDEVRSGEQEPLLTHPAIHLNAASADKAVRDLLESQFSPDADILRELVKNLFPLDPVELTPEILLFHAHSAYLDRPVILLGLSSAGISLPNANQNFRAFFILVSPIDQTNVHLHALTKVARMAKELQEQLLRS